jgi:hypothetical protein
MPCRGVPLLHTASAGSEGPEARGAPELPQFDGWMPAPEERRESSINLHVLSRVSGANDDDRRWEGRRARAEMQRLAAPRF